MQTNDVSPIVAKVTHALGTVLDKLPRGSAIAVHGLTKTIHIQYVESEYTVFALCYDWEDAFVSEEPGLFVLKDVFLSKIIQDVRKLKRNSDDGETYPRGMVELR